MIAAKPRLCVDCVHHHAAHQFYGVSPWHRCQRIPDVPPPTWIDKVTGETRTGTWTRNWRDCGDERGPLTITEYVLKQRCGPDARFFTPKPPSNV
jgi:hypothetical protein